MQTDLFKDNFTLLYNHQPKELLFPDAEETSKADTASPGHTARRKRLILLRDEKCHDNPCQY